MDVWFRELSRTGLSATEQRDLLQRLAWTIDRRTRYFPDSPRAYVERMKELLPSAFLAQKGPLTLANSPADPSDVISRSRAWELAYLELSMFGWCSRIPA